MSATRKHAPSALRVWIVEHRVWVEHCGVIVWSDWSPTFDDNSGPFDCASLARATVKMLMDGPAAQDGEFEYRARAYERVARGTK